MGTRLNRFVEAVLTSTHNLCLDQKYEKYENFLSENFHSLVVKFSVYLNRHVFIMKLTIFIYISKKIGFDVSCKLSQSLCKETICMKCQSIFYGKKKKGFAGGRLLKCLPRILSGKH